MFCPKCDAWSPNDANFCANCGHKYAEEEPVVEEVCATPETVTEEITAVVEEVAETPIVFVEETVDAPVDEPMEEQTEEVVDASVDEPMEEQTEEVVDASVDEPMEEQTEEAVDVPVDELMVERTEEAVDVPVDEPMVEQTEAAVDVPVDEPMEEQTEEAVDVPVDEPVFEMAEKQDEEVRDKDALDELEEILDEPFDSLLEEDQFEEPFLDDKVASAVRDLYGISDEDFIMPEENKVMSVGAYIIAFLLSALPVAGFFIMTIWAAGGAKNRNRSNFAVTVLIVRVLFWALVVGGLVCVYTFNIDLRAIIMNWLTVGS